MTAFHNNAVVAGKGGGGGGGEGAGGGAGKMVTTLNHNVVHTNVPRML